MIMPSEQRKGLGLALAIDAAGGLKHVGCCLASVDVGRARASQKADEIKVKRAISSTAGGFEEVNKRVTESMVDMALKECATMLTNKLKHAAAAAIVNYTSNKNPSK